MTILTLIVFAVALVAHQWSFAAGMLITMILGLLAVKFGEIKKTLP